MLDLSKRSRSGKFRLVTKFKKEKNNKNRAARCSLGAPGTCPLPFPWSPRAPGVHCRTPAWQPVPLSALTLLLCGCWGTGSKPPACARWGCEVGKRPQR